MYETFKDILGLSPEENNRASQEGMKAMDALQQRHHAQAGARDLEKLEAENGSAWSCWRARITTTPA